MTTMRSLHRFSVVFPFIGVHIVVDHYFPKSPPGVQESNVDGAFPHREYRRFDVFTVGFVRSRVVVEIVDPHDGEQDQIQSFHDTAVETFLDVFQMSDRRQIPYGRRNVQHGVRAVHEFGPVAALVGIGGRAVIRATGDHRCQRALHRIFFRVCSDADRRLVIILRQTFPVFLPPFDERTFETFRERKPPRLRLIQTATHNGRVRPPDKNHDAAVKKIFLKILFHAYTK